LLGKRETFLDIKGKTQGRTYSVDEMGQRRVPASTKGDLCPRRKVCRRNHKRGCRPPQIITLRLTQGLERKSDESD